MIINDEKPAVYIYEARADSAYLSEICAGLEEEGIPYTIFDINDYGADAKTLAYNAANHSRLHVGIGITLTEAALQIRNCSAAKPVIYFEISPDTKHIQTNKFRKLGTNAARAVKGGAFI